MSDLIHMMDQLVDKDGKLKIPGIYDDVAVLTTAEAKLYESIGKMRAGGGLPPAVPYLYR